MQYMKCMKKDKGSMVQYCAVEKITKTLQNMDIDSQHFISTKCKLKQINSPFQTEHSAKILQHRTSVNDIHSNTLNQIHNFGPNAIVICNKSAWEQQLVMLAHN